MQPSEPPEVEAALAAGAVTSHHGIVRLLERFRRRDGEALALAVARGTINGIAEWLSIWCGAREAYAVLQRAADKVVAAETSKGKTNVEAKASRRKGR